MQENPDFSIVMLQKLKVEKEKQQRLQVRGRNSPLAIT